MHSMKKNPRGTHGATAEDTLPTTQQRVPKPGTQGLACNLRPAGHLSVLPFPPHHKDKNNTTSQGVCEA